MWGEYWTSVELPTPPPPTSLDMSSTIQQDDLYASNLVVWNEFIDALLDESHIVDLVNTPEEVSLWDTSSPSLEIWFPKSSCSLGFSHLIGDLYGGDTYSVFKDAYMETFFLLP